MLIAMGVPGPGVRPGPAAVPVVRPPSSFVIRVTVDLFTGGTAIRDIWPHSNGFTMGECRRFSIRDGVSNAPPSRDLTVPVEAD